MTNPKSRVFFVIFFVTAAMLLSASGPLFVGVSGNSNSTDGNVTFDSAPGNLTMHSMSPRISPQNGGTPFAISPTNYYRNEPAPMGLSDYGYSNSGGAYKYNSTSFLGTFDLQSLYTYNSTSSQNKNGSAIQLNLILNFTYGGNSYTYWVQDVAAVYTVSGGQSLYITMIDNVWNFSSSSTNIYSSSLEGNGSVMGTTFYYAYASNGLKGNNVTLHAPTKIELKEVSKLSSSGAPEVVVMYNDGCGWTTYDNIVFKFAINPSSDTGFVVSGYSYDKLGTYYDAEMIIGGPGGGASTILQSGKFNITLQYWNGHNYQYVPSAWNFGSDTAETISNALSSFYHSASNATVGSSYAPGSGNLGEVYAPSDLGGINVSLPFNSGSALINNVQYNFTGYNINLSLYPGKYNISIMPSNGSKPLNGVFSVNAGEILQMNEASFGKKYQANITEIGLSANTLWGITLSNGTVYNTTGNQIVLSLVNGSYTIDPNPPSGYLYIGTPINITVMGANISVSFHFNKTFMVNFSENGLTGIEWFVNLSGDIKYSLSGNITFLLVNGTYTFVIQPINGYKANPPSSSIVVNGSPEKISIQFKPILYSVTIQENGLPNSHEWSFSVGGKSFNSNNTSVVLHLANGTYSYTASAGNGMYTLSGANQTFTVNGNNITVDITFKNNYNSGSNLEYKIIFIVFLAAASIAGAISLRRR